MSGWGCLVIPKRFFTFNSSTQPSISQRTILTPLRAMPAFRKARASLDIIHKGAFFIFVVNHQILAVPRRSGMPPGAAERVFLRVADRFDPHFPVSLGALISCAGGQRGPSFRHPARNTLITSMEHGTLPGRFIEDILRGHGRSKGNRRREKQKNYDSCMHQLYQSALLSLTITLTFLFAVREGLKGDGRLSLIFPI